MTQEERVEALAGLLEELTAKVDKQGGELMRLRSHIDLHLHPCSVCTHTQGAPE